MLNLKFALRTLFTLSEATCAVRFSATVGVPSMAECAISRGTTIDFIGKTTEHESCSVSLPNMPRPPRIYIPDMSLHVFQRGLNYSRNRCG